MSTVLKLLLSGIVKYLEAHPEEIDKIVEWAIQELLTSIAPKVA